MSRARILADYVSSGDELADKAPLASPAFTGTPTGITATHVGLGNVTNESKATMFTAPNLTGVTTAASLVLTPGTAPAETEGAMYYDSTSDKVVVWNGTAWEQVSNLIGFEAKGSGGHITDYSIGSTNYISHTFTSSGVFMPTSSFNVDVLVVAGGGGTPGSNNTPSGGGGAGGFRAISSVAVSVAAGPYTITIGAGGTEAAATVNGGSSGASSSALGISASGGGRGAWDATTGTGGGSGGGGSYNSAGGAGNAGGYSPVEGYAGGYANWNSTQNSAGGGGASEAGGAASGGNGGVGGDGKTNDWRTGSDVTYAGGGGGGGWTSSGAGGAGGGGAAGGSAVNGTVNTGGGGGGAGSTTSSSGASGGSGIVVIRYAI